MKHLKAYKQKMLFTVACFITCLFFVILTGTVLDTYAEEGDSLSDYKQTIFNQDNGLGSSEINCIYQTESGYVWIGTEGGLYRYDGSEFKLFPLWDTEKQDVYYINSLYQDSEGRLWVCTNNYGLFYVDNSGVTHFTTEYYSGVKCVNDVVESASGTVYAATAYGVYKVSSDGVSLTRLETIERHNVSDLTLAGDTVYGIYNGNMIFAINDDESVFEMPASNFTEEELSTIASDENGRVYIGTTGQEVLTFVNRDDVQILLSGLNGINDISPYNGRIYLSSDNGVGYFRRDYSFVNIKNLDVDNYISEMMIDYENNMWFASKRSGLLYLSQSKFRNLNREFNIPENITNTVYKTEGNTYFGTDDGLYILNGDGIHVEDELTEYLKGCSIRDILRGSDGTMYFATYRRYGVVMRSPSGEITIFNKAKGAISSLVNCIYELSDGRIAIGTDDGISIYDHQTQECTNYGYEDGIEYPTITSLYQDENGLIYAGSDGGGLYVIDGDEIQEYTEDDGLNSNVVSSLVYGKDGLWIGTNNGLSYYDGTFRSISNIDFSNNIYNLVYSNGYLYIASSKGILYATDEELLMTLPLSERYYAGGDGLEGKLTSNAHDFIDDRGVLYICTNQGVSTFNTKHIVTNDTAPKVIVTDVDVDGQTVFYNRQEGEITIPADAQRVEISFAVFSFSNRENVKVEYQLDGFDTEPVQLMGTEALEAIYTNLDGGTYTIHIRAKNGDGTQSADELTFRINKEYGFFERKSVRAAIIISVILLALAFLYLILVYQKRFRGKNKELEDLAKEREDILKSNTAKTDYLANMSNEIKLPINAMISSAGNMLKEGSVSAETESELRNIIDKGHDVLERVDETILLARLESGAEEVNPEPYSITTLMCDMSDSMMNSLADTSIKFLVDIGNNIPDIMIGDYTKLKTIIQTILDNAVKHTKEGSITLSVDGYTVGTEREESGLNLVFSISDTGIGITEDRLEHVFEIYYEDEAKKSGVNVGNGVSLSIAKRMAEIMDGDIEVESTYGAGSTFTFTVWQGLPEADSFSVPSGDNVVERISREEAEKMWAPDLHVLVVDDMEISRNVTKDVLLAMEINVDTAENGISAIDMVMNEEYDMVFMDIAMPVMNGIDALREIRELDGEQYKTIPVIAMSEDVIGKNRQDIIKEGFSDVILKPFDITVLAGILSKYVNPEKIKYRTSDVSQYITESGYREGLKKLENHCDVVSVLDRIGGNIDVYNRILFSFYNQNKDAVHELKTKIGRDNRGFRNKVHIIRTGCQSIGATEPSEIALHIENALNLGNTTYVRENIGLLCNSIAVVIDSIKEYIGFIEGTKNKPEEEIIPETEAIPEVNELVEEENLETEEIRDEDEPAIINIDKLRIMLDATYAEEIDKIKSIYLEIREGTYGAEDMDFLGVLGESIEKGDMIEINDLLGTYISLKSSL